WNRAQTSWVYTIAIVCFAATFIVAGKLQDAKGPRICAFLGALLVGGGFALSSLTTSVTFLYIAFGVIVGVGNGFGYSAPTPAAAPAMAARTRALIDMRTRDMMTTPTFAALWIAYCLGTTAGQMMISQLVPFMRSVGLTPEAAAFAITIAAFGNAGGRILSGA